MKYVPGYLDSFISPYSGKLIGSNVIPLPEDYTLIGDVIGYAIPSPALIDIRLDIIALRGLLSTAKFLLQKAKEGLDSAQDLSLVQNGMISINNGIIVPTNLTHNYFWVGDDNNRPIETNTIPSEGLPDLTEQYFWLGDSSDRPVETLFNIVTGSGLTGGPIIGNGTISIANTGVIPNVYAYATVNVNSRGQIIAAADNSGNINSILSQVADLFSIVGALSSTVNALSSAVDAIESGIAGIGGFAAFFILQAQVFGLIGAVATHSSQISDLDSGVSIHTVQIGQLSGRLDVVENRLDNLRLNEIPADGDVSFYGFKLIDLQDPTNPQDGATKNYVDNEIDAIPGSLIITLGGAVSGSGPSNTTINTIFNLSLDQISSTNPTLGSVDLNDNRLINLKQSPIENFDAISAQFLWDLMHDEVTVTWL